MFTKILLPMKCELNITCDDVLWD